MEAPRYLGHLEPGMDVCDVDGNKFGSVTRVYRHEFASVGAEEGSSSVGTMPRDEILEVKTGLFGLGKHLYIPFTAIQDVTSGCVFINEPKERLEEQGWETRPDYLDELS
jgi:hypothetical protein